MIWFRILDPVKFPALPVIFELGQLQRMVDTAFSSFTVVLIPPDAQWILCHVFSGDYGDRYFGTDGTDSWSDAEPEELSC